MAFDVARVPIDADGKSAPTEALLREASGEVSAIRKEIAISLGAATPAMFVIGSPLGYATYGGVPVVAIRTTMSSARSIMLTWNDLASLAVSARPVRLGGVYSQRRSTCPTSPRCGRATDPGVDRRPREGAARRVAVLLPMSQGPVLYAILVRHGDQLVAQGFDRLPLW